MTPFQLANYVEAGLWAVMGVGVLTRVRSGGRLAVVAGVTLVVFGGSDVVEAGTGAWWRPWWLFVWKAGCVGVLLGCVGVQVRRKRGAVVRKGWRR